MTAIDFVKYVAILRNVRACLLATSEHPPSEESLSWLKRHVRWRPVGAPPSVLSLLGDFRGKVLELVFPTDGLAHLCDLLSRTLGKYLAEGITLASCYVTPLLLLNRGLVEELRSLGLVLYEIVTDKELKDADLKLHLRIAEYSIKDAHFELIERARAAILSNRVEEIINERRKFCERDSKRYWRVAGEKGKSFLLYIDPLSALKEDMDSVRELLKRDRSVTLGLGVIPALVL